MRRCRPGWAIVRVGSQFQIGEALAYDEADGDGGVDVAAGDVADGEGHGEEREAKGEGYTDEAYAQLGLAAAMTALPQPPKTSQNVPKNSAAARFESGMCRTPSFRYGFCVAIRPGVVL